MNANKRDLNQAASILNKAASKLEAEILATNILMQKLQDKIQSTDEVYAGKIAALKALIENQLARIGDIRDSFGNKFTTEACGVVYFGSSTGSILNNPANFINPWNTFGIILQQPAEQITDLQFEHLAWFFTLQTTIEGQERFLNLFLEPVAPPNAANPHRVNAFAVCPQKVGGVQWFINAGIRDILDDQMGLPAPPIRNPIYDALQDVSDHLKQLSALLTVIDGLTTSLPVGASWDNPDTFLQQNVVLVTGNNPPITLTQNPQSVSVNFNRGVVYATPPLPFTSLPRVGIQPVSTIGPPIWNDDIGGYTRQAAPSSKTINNVSNAAGLASGLIIASGGHFYLKHQFDMGGFIIEQAAGIALGLVTAGLGDVASTAAGVIAGLSSARNDARNIQNDFIRMTDYALFALYQRDFALRGVVITSTDQPPQIVSWPTTNTIPSLYAFNSVLSYNRSDLKYMSDDPDVIIQTHFTWEEFAQDPQMAFDMYALLSLNSDWSSSLYERIGENRANRNDIIVNPRPLPPSERDANRFR